MRYYLSAQCVLKRIETPAVYDISADELYELDEDAFEFLRRCSAPEGCEAEDLGFVEYCLSEGILSTAPLSVRRPDPLEAPKPSLRYLELQITDKCNLTCRHCYLGKAGRRELSLEDMLSVLAEFEELQGLRLLITGGEPLMHSGFRKLNDRLPRYGFRKVLLTNGLLLKRDLLKALNVDEIQFSVDGLEEGHDALRGKGSYRKVLKKIEEALSVGIAVSAATVVHRRNLAEFKAMEVLFRTLGLREWTVDVPCLTGNMKANEHFAVPPEVGGRYLNYGFGGGLHGGASGYACGYHLASVLADGNVCKCAFYSHSPAGNVRDGLRKGWERIRPVSLDTLECASASCPVLEQCRGGCRYRAEMEGGTLKRDLYKCRFHDIL